MYVRETLFLSYITVSHERRRPGWSDRKSERSMFDDSIHQTTNPTLLLRLAKFSAIESQTQHSDQRPGEYSIELSHGFTLRYFRPPHRHLNHSYNFSNHFWCPHLPPWVYTTLTPPILLVSNLHIQCFPNFNHSPWLLSGQLLLDIHSHFAQVDET